MTSSDFTLSIEFTQRRTKLNIFMHLLEDLAEINTLAYNEPLDARKRFEENQSVYFEHFDSLTETDVKILSNMRDAVLGSIVYSSNIRLKQVYVEDTKTYETKGCVYFIENTKENAIKIGYSLHPTNRLNELQVSSSADLILLAVKRGEPSLEKQLHKKFKRSHIRGEWFNPDKDLMEYIDKVKNNTSSNAK